MDTKTEDNVRKKKTCKTDIPQKERIKILNKILANQIQENKDKWQISLILGLSLLTFLSVSWIR